ncbi:DNA polymerase III subunit gamma/tau [Candidatus Peregrinibacteria bacterium]|jgi:DNA polymerase III subunit gamma/tau|nr:DNA polymerase III subunit gamma/tau [Candidatus Peregrinibacteria bacterium]MBT3598561.1 DNA polymerase III subunit gamma/tau [Candidatus Peregrinibacteria bacterium]MBT4367410.1 DNA polymerase III subunit gamma/tau [Candidatus Peregrinibacteria bacterium]MBT4585290.1 DNA polymerase III subunit gamma/tau [Candidatus Peregrinibacteria bacterium]MBT7009442.1 DNA polymerase III subunit gamma/tau [Candidatus Peregrinibacteria bacterium]
MSLYRTYRPLSFADVVGQDHIVTTLEQASAQNKLSHAYLFAGSRGTGKTSVARILAKALMTKEIEDQVMQKQIIKNIEEGNIVDLLEIDAASNRGIDDIRDLIEKIQFSPVVASAKVYIIDEAHMLTKEAFNALLKTLEEPPEYAYFILATTELNKIPVTIQSRCQSFPFRRIREEDIIRRLQYIADQERITIEREALRAIANHVDGGLRDAISLLDQMRSLETITLEDIENRVGSTGMQYVEDVLSALSENDSESILKIVKSIEETGVPLDVFLRQLLKIMRTKLRESVEKKESTDNIIIILDTLLDAIRNLRFSPVPGLVLESALLSMCNSNNEKSNRGDVFKTAEKEESKKEKKEKEQEPKKEIKSTEKEEKKEGEDNQEKEGKEEISEALVEAPELSIESIKEHWEEIVKQASPASVKMSLKNGRVTKIEDGNISISFSSAFHKDTVSKTEASICVEKAIENVFKQNIRIKCVLESDESVANTKTSESVNMAEAAAEIF